MNLQPIDIRYIRVRLGLDHRADTTRIQKAFADALAYRLTTPDRQTLVQRLAHFFTERERLGTPWDSFDRLRKYYLHQAMALHPDRNHSDPSAVERLKTLNAAYELVETIHAEARDYFNQSEAWREEIETEARDALAHEAAANATSNAEAIQQKSVQKSQPAQSSNAAPATGSNKFMAAWVPRNIRTSRLYYLTTNTIIAQRMAPSNNGAMFYDLVMLPELEFMKAKLRLTVDSPLPEFNRSSLSPPYILTDIKTVITPPNEADPRNFARNEFLRLFNVETV